MEFVAGSEDVVDFKVIWMLKVGALAYQAVGFWRGCNCRPFPGERTRDAEQSINQQVDGSMIVAE